ncbi:uncharacterized protein LOC142539962 isoform X2 [Primulina tabacum]|uniref:uncharacterized protein LOC142539962 isoform X2 n=1 Tax=Primulina tabacum TaxID=48773 RepID=UPI003F5AAFFE
MSSEPIGLVHEEDSVEGVHVLDLDVDEETGTNLQGRASGSVKRKRPLKSQWWKYFEMLPEVEGEEKRCKCKACGTTYKAYSSMGTAHFIDSNWVLQKRIINFSYMPPPHSGIALCDKINSLFNLWGIQRKVFTITLDNAAANDVAQKSQLDLYLDEPKIDRSSNCDVLAFWKAYQFRYPELAQMARDILSVPISTVASESSFSTGGRILDQYRSAMKPDVVEALVCCRDWLVGQKETTEVRLYDLTENVMNLFINEDAGSNNAATDD